MKLPPLKEKLLCCGAVAALVLLWYMTGLSCLFLRLFGIPCPGCGMTRAYLALLHLDFAAAFRHHGMFWSVPVLLLFYFLDGRVFRAKWLNTAVLTLIFVGFFVVWMIKLLGIGG